MFNLHFLNSDKEPLFNSAHTNQSKHVKQLFEVVLLGRYKHKNAGTLCSLNITDYGKSFLYSSKFINENIHMYNMSTNICLNNVSHTDTSTLVF